MKPGQVCPSKIVLDQAGSSQKKPDQAKSSWINLGQEQIKPDQNGSSRIRPNQARSSLIKLDQARPNWIIPNQAGSCQIKLDQAGSRPFQFN
jgi:hypothetical protein